MQPALFGHNALLSAQLALPAAEPDPYMVPILAGEIEPAGRVLKKIIVEKPRAISENKVWKIRHATHEPHPRPYPHQWPGHPD
jgi:hypothetical protein